MLPFHNMTFNFNSFFHDVRTKMSGKIMGTTLYITVARDRAGNLSEACDEQKFKLFLVAHADLKLSTNDWIISHGKCSFLKAESR